MIGLDQAGDRSSGRVAGRPSSLATLHAAISTPLHRGALYIFGGAVAGNVLGAVAMLVAARLYPAADVGSGVALMAAAGFLSTVASLALGTGLIRYLPIAADRSRLVRFSVALTAAMSLGAGVVYLAGRGIWARGLPILDSPIFQVAFVLAIGASAAMMLQDGLLIAMRRSGLIAARSVESGVLRILALAGMTALGAFGIFGSWLVALAAPVAHVAARRPSAGIGSASKSLAAVPAGEVVRYSAGNYFIDLVVSLPQTAMPLLIVALLGAAPSAYFSVGMLAALVGYTVSRASAASLQAESARCPESTLPNMTRALRFTLIQTIPLTVAAWVLAEPMLGLFGSAYAAEGAWPLRVLVASSLPLTVGSAYSAVCRARARLAELFMVSLAAAVLSLVVAIALIEPLGLVGPALGMLVWHSTVAAIGGVRLLAWNRAAS